MPGSHECRCPNGTIPEPDARTKCVSLLRCAIDDDCPGNSICDPTKECLCPEPNVGKDCRRKACYSDLLNSLSFFFLLVFLLFNYVSYERTNFLLVNFGMSGARDCHFCSSPTAENFLYCHWLRLLTGTDVYRSFLLKQRILKRLHQSNHFYLISCCFFFYIFCSGLFVLI